MKMKCLLTLSLVLLGISAAPAAAAAGPTPPASPDRPSILQTMDRAHRDQPLRVSNTQRSAASAGPRTTAANPLSRDVFGFLPYWELGTGDLSDLQYDKVQTLAYFGLDVKADGGLLQSGPGWDGWNSAELATAIRTAQGSGSRVVLVVKQFDGGALCNLLSTGAGQTAIGNILNAVALKGVDGVNVDFEGSTANACQGQSIQPMFSRWIGSLSSQLRASLPGTSLTVDTYSGSASWNGGFMRIDTLAPYVDAFFVMAYDMGVSNGADMGKPPTLPNAPLAGPYTYTDTATVRQYLDKVGGDGTKVILGVPYYGYTFSTTGTGFNAPTSSNSATVNPTYATARTTVGCQQMTQSFDSPSTTPWASWFSPATNDPCGGNHNSWREMYWDDATSIGAKYDLVRGSGIRGSGIWALGWDHGYTDLWQQIGNHFQDGVARGHGRQWLARNRDGRLEAFALGVDGSTWHTLQSAPNSGWTAWQAMGGVQASDAAVAMNQDGRLEAFALTPTGHLAHAWQTGPGGPWSAWYSLGEALTGQPYVARNADGRLEVFGRAGNGNILHIWQTAPGRDWSGWGSLGGAAAGSPVVGTNADGRLQMFYRNAFGSVESTWQLAPNGNWGGLAGMGGAIQGDPAIAQNADGRMELFARGAQGDLVHDWQGARNGNWAGWNSLGEALAGDPTTGTNADGRLQVFARAAGGHVLSTWQVATGGWSGWADFQGSMTGAPAAATNADGRLELFSRGSDRGSWHMWQQAPNGNWDPFSSLRGAWA